jgi:hypothetical protein
LESAAVFEELSIVGEIMTDRSDPFGVLGHHANLVMAISLNPVDLLKIWKEGRKDK